MEGSLILNNGEKFIGKWHGKKEIYSGELIYYTGMVHFQEFLTDPANKGKIVLATNPGILNSEIDEEKFESDEVQITALITQSEYMQNEQNEKILSNYLLKNKVPFLTEMDTRAIMKRLRSEGEMKAYLLQHNDSIAEDMKETKTSKKSINLVLNRSGDKHIVVIDFGIKKSLIKLLIHLNYKLTIVSSHVKATDILQLRPDGIVFSGGSGNPTAWKDSIHEYKKIATSYPTIGFGLGHQILAMAFGANVYKMKNGHRSFKQPILHLLTNRVYMSSQNHGYTVAENSLTYSGFIPTFLSVHDGSIEGLSHQDYPINTYQFHLDGKNASLESTIFQSFFQQLEQYKGEKIYAQAP